jgi:hypothetical protein
LTRSRRRSVHRPFSKSAPGHRRPIAQRRTLALCSPHSICRLTGWHRRQTA